MVWAMFVTRHGKAWIKNLYHKFLLFEFSIQKTAFINTDISCFLFDFMVPADGRTAQKWDGPPNRGPLGEPGFCIFHSTAVSLTFQHQLAKIESEVWVTRLWNLSHPPVSIKSPASRRKMRVPHQTILTDSDHTLLYHKLARPIQYLFACQKSQWSMSCNMVKSGLTWSRVFHRRHLGSGWLQSPASDGPPSNGWCNFYFRGDGCSAYTFTYTLYLTGVTDLASYIPHFVITSVLFAALLYWNKYNWQRLWAERNLICMDVRKF